jgi:cytochrome c-type biogenesis protein CcmH/NrfF
MTAAAIAAVVLFPTGAMAQPPLDSAAWLLWRVPWMAFCAVILAILVALFARIELRRSVRRPVESGAAVLRVVRTQPNLFGSREPV